MEDRETARMRKYWESKTTSVQDVQVVTHVTVSICDATETVVENGVTNTDIYCLTFTFFPDVCFPGVTTHCGCIFTAR